MYLKGNFKKKSSFQTCPATSPYNLLQCDHKHIFEATQEQFYTSSRSLDYGTEPKPINENILLLKLE